MKNLLSLTALALTLALTGCSTNAPKVEGGAAVEKILPAYKIAAYVDVATAKSKLEAAGFEVVGSYKSTETSTTLLYTNDALKADANKVSRGLASVGRVLIDDDRKQVSISNPVYFNVAFLQKEYNHMTAFAALTALEKAFGPLKNSEDAWEFAGLADYHFMVGMPYYQDMDVVGEGATADLVAKAKAAKGTIAVVKLADDRYVAFVELDKRNNGFVKKTGTQNAQILPWAVLIEDGKAKALNAKYCIAVSYPLLTMTEFMGIATIPDAITKNLQKIFK